MARHDHPADGISTTLQTGFGLTAPLDLQFPATRILDMTQCQIFGYGNT